MKTITIQVPDDCEVQIVRKEEKKECKFKKGDIIVSSGGSIAVFEKIAKSTRTSNIVVFYSTLYRDGELKCINKVDCGIGYEEDCRYATLEEVNILIDALKEEVSKGNNEAKKVLKEVFDIEFSPVIRTYGDLILFNKPIQGVYLTSAGVITSKRTLADLSNRNIAASEKVAKSMLAMAMISQLMPYYGGQVTDEEWGTDIYKYVIERSRNEINCDVWRSNYCFLAFHTKKQRDEFLKYNERIVKDYLMID